VSSKQKYIFAVLLILAFSLTRLLPGQIPFGLSPVYAIAFCCGVYFRNRMGWILPMAAMLVTDVVLNTLYYDKPAFNAGMLIIYAAVALMIAVGRRFKKESPAWKLLGGGLLGAILFYLITNTAAWLSNPLYAKTLLGWIKALTVGIEGFPPTWMFFKNTLLSSGLFTGLFVGAMKWAEASDPVEAEDREEQEDEAPDLEPEEGKA